MRKNILISTTRQWNPGDEFIMMGSLQILKRRYGDIFNPIIYNRNPDIRCGGKWRSGLHTQNVTYRFDASNLKGKGYLAEIFRIGQFDNSYKDDMDPSCIDLAVFAGSPEWYSRRCLPMYAAIQRANIPTLMFGLGAGEMMHFTEAAPIVHEVLHNARVITTRDRATEALLKDYGAEYIPCPALLSANHERVVSKVNKIGLIYATNKTVNGNKVSEQMHQYIVSLYKEISKKYAVGLVCHYVDEIEQAKMELPGLDISYSYDSKDYESIYNQFDLVIGGRVHGIGISASMGIPGIMIQHDSRSTTTDGFLAKSVRIGETAQVMFRLIGEISENIEEISQNLVSHKEHTMQRYLQKLQGLEI